MGKKVSDKVQKLAKELGIKPEAIEITYSGPRDEVMKKIKADVKDAKKAGFAVESLKIEETTEN